MSAPYTGGCQCGRIRYEIRGEPLTLYCCHCTECQRQSSSAFGMSMPVLSEAVVITRGEPKEWRRKADSGNEVICRFCPDCGTRLFHNPTRNLKVTNVKPGSLDDTRWISPIGHLWTRSAQPWMAPGADTLSYESQPQDFAPLFDRWRHRQPSAGADIAMAQPGDLDKVLALITAQFEEHDIDAPVDRVRAAIAAVLSDARLGLFLLARRDDRAVGVAYVSFVWALEHCGRSSWLEELYVVPSERGRGLGAALLQAVLAETRARGCAAVDLEVEHSQKRAENLYRRAGFEPHTRARFVRRADVQTN